MPEMDYVLCTNNRTLCRRNIEQCRLEGLISVGKMSGDRIILGKCTLVHLRSAETHVYKLPNYCFIHTVCV